LGESNSENQAQGNSKDIKSSTIKLEPIKSEYLDSADNNNTEKKSESHDTHFEDNDPSKKEKPTRIDTQMELAFQYFDKNRSGYLLDKDLEHLFHCLSKGFSKKYVRDLVAMVCETHKREHTKVLLYRQLVEFYD